MYTRKLQYSLVPTIPDQNLPTIILQEQFACPWCGFFINEGCCHGVASGPVYQGIQQLEKSSGPSRTPTNQTEFRKAEPQQLYQPVRESSGAISVEDTSIGFNPGQAWIGANDYTRGGKVWRTPSKNHGWLIAT